MKSKLQIESIRFLPMGTNIFKDKDEVLQFLRNGLHKQKGYYYYIKRNILLDGNTLVLFQFQGELIASAVMIDQDDTPLDSGGILYNGRYHFDTESIVIFKEAITAEEFKGIDSSFSGFNQSTRAIDISLLEEIIKLIDEKKIKKENFTLARINKTQLGNLCNAYILYEMASHGIDPRETLEGTDLRLEKCEGYKYEIFSTAREILDGKGEYVEKILNLLTTTKQNLVDYHQITKISQLADGAKRILLEDALTNLYEGEGDESAFNSLTGLIGGSFDVLGFLFFLKDSEKYLPIRSSLFDERFERLGVNTKLSGNCSFAKYSEFVNLVSEVQLYLQKHLNQDITLLDAHSFLWILPYLEKYLNQKMQPVVHKKFGRGVLTGVEGGTLFVEFYDKPRMLEQWVVDQGILTVLPLEWNIYSKEEPIEQVSVGEVYAELNKPRIKTVNEWELILKHEIEHNKGFNFVEKVLLEMYKRDEYAVFCKNFEKEIGCKGLNLRVGEFRDRIKKIDGINLSEQIRSDTNTDRAWNIPFETDEWLNENSVDGSFSWVLRNELIRAIENVFPEIRAERTNYARRKDDEKNFSLNLIDKPVVFVEVNENVSKEDAALKELHNRNKFYPPKKDYLQEQIRNKRIGDAGEDKIVQLERERLTDAGRRDLAEKVHIAPSDAHGYDVESFNTDGTPKHIEVKTSTRTSEDIMFHITANEVLTILDDPAYELYYLYCTKQETIKIKRLSRQYLMEHVIKQYMTPTQYIVKIPM